MFLNSTVTRILWSREEKGRASEVEYVNDNRTLTIAVGKEVIVSAGTIGSPKILELSGVGNER